MGEIIHLFIPFLLTLNGMVPQTYTPHPGEPQAREPITDLSSSDAKQHKSLLSPACLRRSILDIYSILCDCVGVGYVGG